MRDIKSGIIASIVATFVTGAIMLINNAVHRLPNLGTGQMLASAVGVPDHPMVGWAIFLVFAAFVWGVVFAHLAPSIPVRSYVVKGLILAVVTWLLVTLVIMPLAGMGVFGSTRPLTPAIALFLAMVYWSVLSLVYRWCAGPARKP